VLAVTAPAVADQISGAPDHVARKLGGRPVVILRGLPAELLDPAAPGAASLIRDEDGDLFGLGSREAVLVAVGHDESPRGFPAAEPGDDLLALAREGIDATLVEASEDGDDVVLSVVGEGPEAYVEAGRLAERVRILAKALRRTVFVTIV
ncbi:MAG: F420-dependent oxidoreductase, partial [Aeromicrobium sp.]